MANAKRFLACLSKCYYLLSALSYLATLAPLMASYRATCLLLRISLALPAHILAANSLQM